LHVEDCVVERHAIGQHIAALTRVERYVRRQSDELELLGPGDAYRGDGSIR
jgi:hypothetical protein